MTNFLNVNDTQRWNLSFQQQHHCSILFYIKMMQAYCNRIQMSSTYTPFPLFLCDFFYVKKRHKNCNFQKVCVFMVAWMYDEMKYKKNVNCFFFQYFFGGSYPNKIETILFLWLNCFILEGCEMDYYFNVLSVFLVK